MAQAIWDFFVSFFQNPSGWGIGLAFAFGAVWLAAFAPPLRRLGLRTPLLIAALLAVFVSSAILTLAAISFIQIPLQTWSGQALNHFWSEETLLDWILLAGIPADPSSFITTSEWLPSADTEIIAHATPLPYNK